MGVSLKIIHPDIIILEQFTETPLEIQMEIWCHRDLKRKGNKGLAFSFLSVEELKDFRAGRILVLVLSTKVSINWSDVGETKTPAQQLLRLISLGKVL